MSCIPQARAADWLTSTSAITLVISALPLAVLFAVQQHPLSFALALLFTVALVLFSRIDAVFLRRRLLLVNLFSVLLFLVLPLTVPGNGVAASGSFTFSYDGLIIAARIAARLNLIVVLMTVLLSPLSSQRLGRALTSLGLPTMLVHLLLFAVRYTGLIRSEYEKVFTAMRLRGFQPSLSGLTIRSYAYAVGMVLVRSADRAERIGQAMTLRGFSGALHGPVSERNERINLWLIAAVLAVIGAITALETGWLTL